MKVEKKEIDALNIELTVSVSASDYAPISKKKFAERKRTADFKGFRPGNVPASLIQRVYGEQILVDSVNECVGNAIDGYVSENKLHLIGEPLGSEKQQEVEWKDGNDFEFVFDAAIYPEVKVEVEKEDTINKYNITLTAADKKKMADSLKKYYEEKKEEKSEEEIDKEVTERMTAQYEQEAEWRLSKDIRDFYVQKAGVTLPEEFLKRWLFVANGGKVTKEDIDKDFGGFAEDFKWQLVRGTLMESFGFKVEENDLTEAAKAYVSYQYAMYGIPEVPEDMLQEAVKNILQDQKQIDRLVEQVEDNKVISKIKETVTIKAKKISAEKFRAL